MVSILIQFFGKCFSIFKAFQNCWPTSVALNTTSDSLKNNRIWRTCHRYKTILFQHQDSCCHAEMLLVNFFNQKVILCIIQKSQVVNVALSSKCLQFIIKHSLWIIPNTNKNIFSARFYLYKFYQYHITQYYLKHGGCHWRLNWFPQPGLKIKNLSKSGWIFQQDQWPYTQWGRLGSMQQFMQSVGWWHGITGRRFPRLKSTARMEDSCNGTMDRCL